MKKLIVKCMVELTDVYDDSWETDPTLERVQNAIEYHLRKCISDDGTVDLQAVKVIYEVMNNGDD